MPFLKVEAAPPPTSLKTAEEKGKAYLEKLGAHDLKSARALSAEVLQKGAEDRFNSTGLVVDGEAVVADQDGLLRDRKYNDIPILVGTNSIDGSGIASAVLKSDKSITGPTFEQMARLILTMTGAAGLAEPVLRTYPHTTEAEATKAAKDLCSDLMFAWSAWAWADLQSKSTNNKSFIYYFDHRTPSSPEGANHGAEILYVFGNLNIIDALPGLGELRGIVNRPEDKALSELMTSYWVNFAKKGNPNGPGLPVWPAFDGKQQKTMVFDKTPGARPYPNLERMKVFATYYSEKKTKQ